MNDLPVVSLPFSRYLILGLGQTGQAVARWLARQGASLTLVDTRPSLSLPNLRQELQALTDSQTVQWHLSDRLPASLLADIQAIVISPGLVPTESPVCEFLQAAEQAGCVMLNEVELFAQALQALRQSDGYEPEVLAITGTNGKTTVTALTRLMLENAGISAVACGNISPAALDALSDAIVHAREEWPRAWVLELSSFQLHYLTSLEPSVATVLNVSQDHIDWHGSFQAYCADKAKIFEKAKTCVVNRDDVIGRQMVPTIEAMTVRSFGLDQPVYAHDVGVQASHDVRWLASSEPEEFEDQVKPTRRRKGEPPPVRQTGRLVRLMPVDALPLVGSHNAMNVLAAALLAKAAGASWAGILKAASAYQGEPNRMQFVRTIREVDFFNDSKGTNVGATVAGLLGLGRSVVLIAGGQSKGQDFAALAKAVGICGRGVVLIGEDAPHLQQALLNTGVPCELRDDMAAAVLCAFEMARPGDAVVLSPACASFDMFDNYVHRGEAFVTEVTELSLELGEVA